MSKALKKLTGDDYRQWLGTNLCPSCEAGDLEGLPDCGRSGFCGVVYTDLECLECQTEVSHVHNQSVQWFEEEGE